MNIDEDVKLSLTPLPLITGSGRVIEGHLLLAADRHANHPRHVPMSGAGPANWID